MVTTALRADVVWRAGAQRIDPRLLDLLRALRNHATLKAAAQEIGLSYRGAWGMLLEAAALAGAPFVELRRGRGARLTRLGAQLLHHDESLRQALLPLHTRFEIKPPAAAEKPAHPLRIVASHDPLLAEFCERFAMPAGLVEEISFRGSEDALARYARGGADIAGFHFAGAAEAASMRRLLSPRRDRLIRFADREQGLMVARGNPKRLAGLADVAQRHARFVNRQRGSGTRRLVDRLLQDADVAPDSIRGYATEEYTHRAVAATIAAGRADAGFGVEAAAVELGLDFVPVLTERYWLAIREPLLATPAVQQLLRALAGKPLSRLGRRLAGYTLEGAGAVASVEEAFR